MIEVLTYLYFVTLSADQLHLPIGLFKLKVNHCIAPLLLFTLLSNKIQIPKDILISFALIGTSLFFSAVFSPNLIRSGGYLLIYLFFFCCYFLVPYNLIQRIDPHRLWKIYLASFYTIGAVAALQVLLSLFGVEPPFSTQNFAGIARGQALAYEPSYYALYLAPIVTYLNAESRRPPIFLNLFFILSTTVTALFSYLLFFLLTIGRLRLKFLSLILFFLAMFAYLHPLFFITTFGKFFHSHFTSHHSFAERWDGIVDAWNLFLAHPLFGVGLGGVGPTRYLEQAFTPSATPPLKTLEWFDPTNLFTEILASLGLFGLFAFSFFAFILARRFLRTPNTPLLLSLLVLLGTLQINQGIFRTYAWVHIALTLSFLPQFFLNKNVSHPLSSSV